MRTRLLLPVLLAGALAAAGPARAGTPEESAARPDADLAAAIRRAIPAFVFVGGGSGVAISADGYVLLLQTDQNGRIRVLFPPRMKLSAVASA